MAAWAWSCSVASSGRGVTYWVAGRGSVPAIDIAHPNASSDRPARSRSLVEAPGARLDA